MVTENPAATVSATNLKRLGLRACGTCVRAKVKCVPSTHGRQCHRCHRLQKTCEPPSTSSRKRSRSMHVAQLEKKLDGLVTLLTAPSRVTRRHEEQTSSPSTLSMQELESSNSSSNTRSQLETEEICNDVNSLPTEMLSGCPSVFLSTQQSPSSGPSTHTFDIPSQEADLLLLDFRTRMASQIPFVVIPPLWNSNDLRRQKPFLWKAVMTAASYQDSARQDAFGWMLMQDFSSRVLLKSEKSLDLLQGLLVHINWYHFHVISNPQITNLLHLAKALISGLGYQRNRTVKDCRQILVDDIAGTSHISEVNTVPPSSKTLEEWRTLAGCFAIISMAVTGCRRTEPLQYTQHIEESCKRLAEIQQYEQDKVILYLCRLQSIALKINSIYDGLENGSWSANVPVKLHIKVLRGELETLKENIPKDIRDRVMITANLHITEINLYEIGLYNAFYGDMDKLHRIDTLHACLISVKSFFENFFHKETCFRASTSYFNWVQTGYLLLMGVKLCVCTAEGWDLQYAREILNFPVYVDGLIQKIEIGMSQRAQARNRLENGAYEPDIFSRFLRQLQFVRTWYDSTLPEASNGQMPLKSPYSNSHFHQLSQRNMDPLATASMACENQYDASMNLDIDFWNCMYNCNDDWMIIEDSITR